MAVTDAYDLDARYVLHAAAMPHYGDGQATEASIRRATENALETADELASTSLVLPALGCGVAGFDLEEGARVICEVIDGHEPTALDDVRVIGYGDAEYETIRAVAREFDSFVG